METKDKITFEIEGNDLKSVKKFRKQHKNCFQGVTGEQFEYWQPLLNVHAVKR